MHRSIPVIAALVSTAALCQAQTVSEIPAPTVPIATIDLDTQPVGPITVATLQGLAPSLANFTLTPNTAAAGIYNTQAQWQGLGNVAGVLSIIPTGGTAPFDPTNAQLDFNGQATEVGFGIGDWVGPMILDFYSGGVLVTTYTTTSQTGNTIYYQMAGGTFDRVDIRASTTGGNWVIADAIEVQILGSNFASKTPFGEGCNLSLASFYESHTAFDLSGTSLLLTNTGNGYLLLGGGTTAVVPSTSTPVVMGDDVVLPFALGWTLPYPGGTTTDLYVSSNGFVNLTANTNSGCCSFILNQFLNNGPVFAAKWRDLNPSAGGSVYFDTDAVNGTATVTFDMVPDYGSSNQNTFQYYFDSTGTVELRFGSVAATAGGTGWSPGLGNLDPGSIDLSATAVLLTGPNDVFPLALSADNRPVLGTTINLTVDNVPTGSALGAVIYGLTKHDPGIDLTSLGMPGCFQFCSQDAVALTVAPAGTSFTSVWTLPASTILAGVHVQAQGAIYDPVGGHNGLGALSSNAIDFGLDVN